MSRILVALDDSRGSEQALEAAVRLAQQDGGRLTAVAVLEQTGNPALDQLAEDVKTQATDRLNVLLQTAVNYARSRGVRLIPILHEGHPAEAILRCVEEEQASLLVLGAGSRNGDAGLGGTADQVSNHCPCTVLIARGAAQEGRDVQGRHADQAESVPWADLTPTEG
ncbi:MAG: universal stress protein [Thermoguttaceae bacterium]|jgi:nucleotide-binding universal stress UspA family protein|nr:universal stress protein [Thermoguttaceae bacterium]